MLQQEMCHYHRRLWTREIVNHSPPPSSAQKSPFLLPDHPSLRSCLSTSPRQQSKAGASARSLTALMKGENIGWNCSLSCLPLTLALNRRAVGSFPICSTFPYPHYMCLNLLDKILNWQCLNIKKKKKIIIVCF